VQLDTMDERHGRGQSTPLAHADGTEATPNCGVISPVRPASRSGRSSLSELDRSDRLCLIRKLGKVCSAAYGTHPQQDASAD
jgi:hypothetical protein